MPKLWDINGPYVEAFVAVDTGAKHPDPQYASAKQFEYRWQGQTVRYIYEGKLNTLRGWTSDNLDGLNALRDQLREFFPFDAESVCFQDNDR